MKPTSKTYVFDPTFINTIISADNPNEQNSLLRQVVFKYNTHIPWGNFNYSAVCMIAKICSKRFSKDFVEKTDHHVAQL